MVNRRREKSMTRPTRMLIILGLFGVGGIFALSMMAHRYGKLMRQAEDPRSGTPVGVVRSGSADGDSRAERDSANTPSLEARVRALSEVDRFIAVRRALAELSAKESEGQAAAAGLPIEERAPALDRALEEAGMAPATYERLLDSYAAWMAGRTDLRAGLAEAFARRREELERLE
jgi:hypothetical protein